MLKEAFSVRLSSKATQRTALVLPVVSAHLCDIDVVGVMFCRSDHQCDAFIQLDAGQGGDAHVQKDSKQHSQRNVSQDARHHDGHACGTVKRRRVLNCDTQFRSPGDFFLHTSLSTDDLLCISDGTNISIIDK